MGVPRNGRKNPPWGQGKERNSSRIYFLLGFGSLICYKYLYWNNIGQLTILYCLITTLMQDALVKPSESQFDLLVKKMQYLIEMGNGETILEVGAGEGN